MPELPARFGGIILAFALLFVHRSWPHAQVLLIGAILTPGWRTVVSVLRILGRTHEKRFVNAHRILLGLFISAFAPRGPEVLGLDDTIEQRWGRRI